MTSTTSPFAAGLQLTEREWDKLTNIVSDGCVVPVIGPELLRAIYEGNDESMYAVWGRVLAEEANASESLRIGASVLYEVTNRLGQTRNSYDLAYDIDDVIRRRPWPIPPSLQKLAAISSFPLYVTTTIDHLLKTALDQEQPHQSGRTQEIVFAPRGDKGVVDLPDDFGYSRAPAIFYLFGATASADGVFAKTEDDLIEFSWSLLDKQYAPERLYDYLRQKTVLLLGCDFPDWLGRFFVHALNAGRQEGTINIYYVSERRESGLEDFLRRKRAKVLVPASPVAFIDELHRRWQLRIAERGAPKSDVNAPIAPVSSFKRGAVFLSYASEDREAVGRIRAQLEAANIDTWMDESGLEPGDEFQQVIHDNIRNASFFIAVVSRSLNRGDRPRRFYLREWKWAEDENMERRKEERFLQTLVIDGTPPGASFVDPPYRNLHWTQLREGRLSDDFIQLLAQGIRRFRRTR